MTDITKLAQDQFARSIQAVALGAVTNITTNTSTSTAMGSGVATYTAVVRLVATTDTWVQIAASPTAASSTSLLPAGVAEYFRVEAGWKVAGLAVSLAGTLNVTECR